MLKNIISFLAIALILVGVIWVLQGINILPGSFMTGNPQWAINGAISIAVGCVLFWLAKRK